jgi:hypothetical protein
VWSAPGQPRIPDKRLCAPVFDRLAPQGVGYIVTDQPEAGAAEPENDLDRLERKVDAILHMCITNRDLSAKIASVVEVERRLVDRFDDRLARAEALEKSLGSTVMKLTLARLPTSIAAGAIAGLVAAAAVTYLLFGGFGGIASAH